MGATDRPKHWPKHVSAISIEGLGSLGIDPSNGELYWDGRKLAHQHIHGLRNFERILALLTAASAVVLAMIEVGRVAHMF
ncbi:hypothetical protein [Mesorhizobium escarrei]|uniref:Uncharacterized protein n=1 Tax=Mesorhizobium escarrei TaxID=666018 RepID=A0ABM9E106_9HYPH|nr:hypothetical protein [Mesorhizobium escarrei]CAH2402749.1 hypothetical protein MES5069_350034 [Mesorhizobium escarrei]